MSETPRGKTYEKQFRAAIGGSLRDALETCTKNTNPPYTRELGFHDCEQWVRPSCRASSTAARLALCSTTAYGRPSPGSAEERLAGCNEHNH